MVQGTGTFRVEKEEKAYNWVMVGQALEVGALKNCHWNS